MIFIIFEEDDIIRRGIWPCKDDTTGKKSKPIYYKNRAPTILVIEPEFYSIITQNNGKATTHFGKSVKNRLFLLKKGFKEVRTNLGVTGGVLPNEDAIWPERKICNKWKEVTLTCPSYFYMKV